MEPQRLDLPVNGMHCASCVSRIEKNLQDLPGVQDAQVNLATERATLHFDAAELTIDRIIEAVEDTGYQVPRELLTLPIRGMSCASCVARIERALNQVDGVVEAHVNLGMETARVAYLPTQVEIATLRQAITDAGYEPLEVLDAESGRDREREARAMEIRRLTRKFTVSLGLSMAIFLGSMGTFFSWLPSGLHNPYVLLILATPVQFWAGWPFYQGFWAALKHKTADMNTLIAIGTCHDGCV